MKNIPKEFWEEIKIQLIVVSTTLIILGLILIILLFTVKVVLGIIGIEMS